MQIMFTINDAILWDTWYRLELTKERSVCPINPEIPHRDMLSELGINEMHSDTVSLEVYALKWLQLKHQTNRSDERNLGDVSSQMKRNEEFPGELVRAKNNPILTLR